MNDPVISAYISHHNEVLLDLINEAYIPAPRIREAVLYALFPGGKRLRPVLVYLCGEILETPQNVLDTIATAIELTHCYSLVHDDLPAMDNDDYRRGKPSCHRAFDEATAILVGDGLQALAIDSLLGHLPQSVTISQTIKITQELVRASGLSGMVSGQSLDLSELAKIHVTSLQLTEIHQLKTGKLISACIHMVLAAGNPSPIITHALRQFSDHLGLYFQMQDDYLDRYDTTSQLGKGRASDTANQKTTFATQYSQNDLLKLIDEHYLLTKNALAPIAERATNLLKFIENLRLRIDHPGKIN